MIEELIKNELFDLWYTEQKQKLLIVFIEGESGSGKSSLMLKLMYEFEKFASQRDGKEFKFDIEKQIIYTPIEYSHKIQEWIRSDHYTIGIDEARFLVSARTWQTFVNRIITEANATLRQLKHNNNNYCGIIFINSQDFSDVDKSLRLTVNYLIRIKPKGRKDMHRVVTIYEVIKLIDEKKILRKKLTLNVLNFDVVCKFKVRLIDDKNLLRKYHEHIVEAKSQILRKKFEKLKHVLKQEIGEVFDKSILKNDEVFNLIKNMSSFSEKKGVYFTREKQEIIMRMFNLTKKEFKEVFYKAFLDELKERNLI